jgi:hypothetical protein
VEPVTSASVTTMAHRPKTAATVASKPTGAKAAIKTKVVDNSTNLSRDKLHKVTLINSRRIPASNSDNQRLMTHSIKKLVRRIKVRLVSAEIRTNNRPSTRAEADRITLTPSKTINPNCNSVAQRDNQSKTTTNSDKPNLPNQA